ALATLGTIREESATVLQLNPASVDGLVLAGGIAAGLPAMMGGDRAKAEAYFRHAIELDPHRTGARLELAKLYLATKRWSDARRELQRIVEEPTPSDLPRWTVSDAPRARALLAELGGRGAPVVTTETTQSP
ncbi:MAG TPA: tetratricopeptide repeat protein, partial [Methylomirabilota bacterium]|nr:tetratricopeptide repeat protein [Methylomirabilota bacterium]